VIGAVRVTRSVAPDVRGKDDNRQKKEDAHHFEQKNSTYTAKRAQKPTNSLADVLPCWVRDLSGPLPCRGALNSGVTHLNGLRARHSAP